MRTRSDRGQALIEFALVLPLLFLLVANAVNWAGYLYACLSVSNAARAGADYLMMGPAYAGHQTFPSATQVTNLVNKDLLSLPNRSSVSVTVCTNNNGAIETPPSGVTCLATVTDPQNATSVVGQVNVTYTYVPFIPLWSFNRLGINLTIPTTTIRRHAAVRLAM